MRRGVGTLSTFHHKYQPVVFENATTTEIRNLVLVDDLTVATSFVYQSWVCSVACEIVNSISECILYVGKVLENLDCNNYLLAFLPLQLEVCCLRVDSKGILLIGWSHAHCVQATRNGIVWEACRVSTRLISMILQMHGYDSAKRDSGDVGLLPKDIQLYVQKKF